MRHCGEYMLKGRRGSHGSCMLALKFQSTKEKKKKTIMVTHG